MKKPKVIAKTNPTPTPPLKLRGGAGKELLLFFILLVLITPIFSFAQNQGPFVPDCGPQNNCGYRELLILVNNIINWIIIISVPVAAGVFAWAGFKLMTTGIVDERTAAKEMFWKVFWGFVFILSAWIIVNTITNTLLTDKYGFREAVPVQGTNKN